MLKILQQHPFAVVDKINIIVIVYNGANKTNTK